MNTLKSHTILYDKDCPLCNIYTSTFISTKMLDVNGRKPFEEITINECNYVDVNRATNEIALLDKENQKVLYGVDSLLKVIGNSYPIIEKVGKVKPIYYCLRKLYSFISYNRKVIIPSKRKETTALACVPSFNIKYRLLYIIFSIILVAFTLFHFSTIISSLPSVNFNRELLLATGQIVFQSIFLIRKDFKKVLNYIGNLMTVSLIGCIGLVQTIVLNMIIPLPQVIILISFLGIVGIMFFEHKRRVALLDLPGYLTYTWVVYRLIALLIILNI